MLQMESGNSPFSMLMRSLLDDGLRSLSSRIASNTMPAFANACVFVRSWSQLNLHEFESAARRQGFRLSCLALRMRACQTLRFRWVRNADRWLN